LVLDTKRSSVSSGLLNMGLAAACEAGDFALAKRCLEEGADAALLTHSGQSMLHLAARFGPLALGELLISRGANAHHMSKHHASALHVAAVHKRVPWCELLVGAGADINGTSPPIGTPLSVAGDAKTCAWLMAHGAVESTVWRGLSLRTLTLCVQEFDHGLAEAIVDAGELEALTEMAHQNEAAAQLRAWLLARAARDAAMKSLEQLTHPEPGAS
jgi:hypothetical protein